MSYAARANKYARDVRDGRVPAGSLVQASCNRHLDDLARSKDKDYPYRFDAAAADRICSFASNMVHIKGKWADTRRGALPFIVLEDWQVFLLAVPFGWLRKSDGLRRFRELYAEIPRKNSKSTMGAIIGLYMAFADGEPGAEVYAGATSLDQAYQVFRPAWMMVHNNPAFQEHFGLELAGTTKQPGNIYQLRSGSRFEALIGKPGDGASPNCAIVDEFHEHTTSELYDAMKTGMGAREAPMRVVITTAGTDLRGPCYDKREEAVKVLKATLENDDLFVVIYSIDAAEDGGPGDDWADFGVWKKANPNLGVSVFEDYLRGQLRDALQKPSEQNVILTKHLNLWRNASKAWMNMAHWERQRDSSLTLEQFFGSPCFLAFDLAAKIDIAALAYIIKANDKLYFFAKHYLPSDQIELPANAHYRRFRDQGWLTETPGARIDHRAIEDEIRWASDHFDVKSLRYDPKESNYLISNIQTWAPFECVEIQQVPAQMNEPMKEMEAQIYAGTLFHQGDPCLTWQMSNVMKKEARGGGSVKYYFPTKQNDASKIDAPVAGMMGVGGAMAATTDREPQLFFV